MPKGEAKKHGDGISIKHHDLDVYARYSSEYPPTSPEELRHFYFMPITFLYRG